MPMFLDLPVELLPIVLRHIISPQHLASCCLVNKTFYSFAIPQLYKHIYIYAWQKHPKEKVTSLFKTLSSRPDLAQWLRILELRDFPKSLYLTELYNSLTETCLKGLANCVSLRSCTWTRDETLSTEILEVLSSKCLALRELEINGHATGIYNAQSLLRFTSLSKISLIMPSAEVISVLPSWFKTTGATLTAFHVLSKATSHITDSTLETLAPYMNQLERFHIAGCPRVTHKGVLSVLSRNSRSLKSMALEGVSSVFDLSELARNASPCTSLVSLILTLPPTISPSSWCSSILEFTAHSPLAELQLYFAGNYPDTHLQIADFVNSILEVHALKLRKFSFHRLALQPEVVDAMCASCPNLETLFILVNTSALERLVLALAQSNSLRDIHVNFTHASLVTPSEVLSIASKLGSQVRYLGFMNRVYQLDRVARINEAKEVTIDVVLAPCEQPQVPEQFLVIRT